MNGGELVIVELRAGSHLYGTATARSDTDLKAVHVPKAADILLQRAARTVSEGPGRGRGERNQAGDVDRESYSLQRYLELVSQGQPLALEMLFAPDECMTGVPDPLWREVQAMAPLLVSRRASVFLRYARQQAERYGTRGARAAAARQAVVVLAAAEGRLGGTARLGTIETELAVLEAGSAHVGLVDVEIGDGRVGRHLDLCGRKAPLHASLKAAREMAERLLAEYGDRALGAEQEGGVDWKALSHAVRVGQEAVELLETGRLLFPLRDAARLLAIKLGELEYSAVVDEIENLFVKVGEAAARSVLRDEPDAAAAEAFVLRVHRRQVLGW